MESTQQNDKSQIHKSRNTLFSTNEILFLLLSFKSIQKLNSEKYQISVGKKFKFKITV